MGNHLAKRASAHEDEQRTIDGGYLLPQTTLYPESARVYSVERVRTLQLGRRLAPFYAGLDEAGPFTPAQEEASPPAGALDGVATPPTASLHSTMSMPPPAPEAIPVTARSVSFPMGSVSPATSAAPSIQLPTEATVECPICFLYYPPNINETTCCGEPICTDCLIHIRPSPNPSCPYCATSPFTARYGEGGKEVAVSEMYAPPAPTPPAPEPSRAERRRARHEARARRATTLLVESRMDGTMTPRSSARYVASMRSMGMDIEEMMLAEAIRRSLLEDESSGEGTAPAEEAGEETETPPSAMPMTSRVESTG